jgi:hypothetical protein
MAWPVTSYRALATQWLLGALGEIRVGREPPQDKRGEARIDADSLVKRVVVNKSLKRAINRLAVEQKQPR